VDAAGKELAALGLLTGLDRNLLAAYCQTHAPSSA
jgi:phage terminase small subunit